MGDVLITESVWFECSCHSLHNAQIVCINNVKLSLEDQRLCKIHGMIIIHPSMHFSVCLYYAGSQGEWSLHPGALGRGMGCQHITHYGLEMPVSIKMHVFGLGEATGISRENPGGGCANSLYTQDAKQDSDPQPWRCE